MSIIQKAGGLHPGAGGLHPGAGGLHARIAKLRAPGNASGGAPRRINSTLVWRAGEADEKTFPIHLYRFLRDTLPVVSGCVWTWSRLAAAPARFIPDEDTPARLHPRASQVLDNLGDRIFPFRFRQGGGLSGFLPLMFESLFTDGAFAGFVELSADMARVERITPIDVTHIRPRMTAEGPALALETEWGETSLDGREFIYFGLNSDPSTGLGRSILSATPFVAFIEQQLMDDMRRSSHNAGFHRLHVRVTPPERQAGEAPEAYVSRANEYFDKTANLMRDLTVEDNPVTWNDIAIEYIGPERARGQQEAWFVNHRAVIEEICAAANLSPFLLGYSFGATESWSSFKYDLVMRQAQSIQQEAARLLESVGNLELALAGVNARCRLDFDNRVSFTAPEAARAREIEVKSLLALLDAGLVEKDDALRRARRLLG